MTDRILWSRPHHRRPRRDLKQLISLKFLIASAHWACADVLDHHIMEAIAYRNLDRPTYLGSSL